MCGTCGCGDDDHITYRKPSQQSEHTHEHFHGPFAHVHPPEQISGQPHEHPHAHARDHEHSHVHHNHVHNEGNLSAQTIQIQRNILSKNDLQAERNRGYFEALKVVSFNLVSSPGSGKTAILERSIKEMDKRLKVFVIEGDQQTLNDAQRIEKAGAPVIQINTGNGCHLDALMVNKAIKQLEITPNSVLFIENVGNLVCPALFDLGETKRVVIVSVTEGEDKPAKYPNMFETAQLCLINKTDLLPYLDYDLDLFMSIARNVNPDLEYIQLSAKTGEGFNLWLDWIDQEQKRLFNG